MRAFFKAKDQLEQDEIAARQCWVLQAFQGARDTKLRLTDVNWCVRIISSSSRAFVVSSFCRCRSTSSASRSASGGLEKR